MATLGFIEASYQGIRAETAKTDDETKTTFRHALACFGFLVHREKISLDEFKNRIIRTHDENEPRVRACIKAIEKTIQAEN